MLVDEIVDRVVRFLAVFCGPRFLHVLFETVALGTLFHDTGFVNLLDAGEQRRVGGLPGGKALCHRLVEGGDPKETYNFEREGEVMLTVSYSPEDEAFALRYPKQKDASLFDDIDLVAIEIYDMIY